MQWQSGEMPHYNAAGHSGSRDYRSSVRALLQAGDYSQEPKF